MSIADSPLGALQPLHGQGHPKKVMGSACAYRSLACHEDSEQSDGDDVISLSYGEIQLNNLKASFSRHPQQPEVTTKFRCHHCLRYFARFNGLRKHLQRVKTKLKSDTVSSLSQLPLDEIKAAFYGRKKIDFGKFVDGNPGVKEPESAVIRFNGPAQNGARESAIVKNYDTVVISSTVGTANASTVNDGQFHDLMEGMPVLEVAENPPQANFEPLESYVIKSTKDLEENNSLTASANKPSTSVIKLLQTYQEDSAGENLSKCPLCRKAYPTRELLCKHIAGHRPEVLTCANCHQHFQCEETLNQHQCRKTENSLQCGLCGELVEESNFKNHAEDHRKDDRKNLCCVCGFVSYGSNLKMERHMITHSSWDNAVSCDRCGKSFKHRVSLAEHIRLTHSVVKSFICETCGKCFQFARGLRRHAASHFEDEGGNFECQECGRKFAKDENLKAHMASAHTITQTCPKCGQTFKTRRAFNVHLASSCVVVQNPEQNVSSGAFENCSECGQKFVSLRALNVHLASNSCQNRATVVKKTRKEKKCICTFPDCGKCFLYPSLLRNHLEKIHYGLAKSPAFECHLCQKKMTTKNSLKLHLANHNNVTYQCTLCTKTFKTKSYLRTHFLSHTGEKPHKCRVCSKQFRQKGDRDKHESRMHVPD